MYGSGCRVPPSRRPARGAASAGGPLRAVPRLLARLVVLVALALAPAWGARGDAPTTPEHVWVSLGGETFELELASTPAQRYRGLSDRGRVPRNGGMLFVWPRSQPLAMVMRDCPAPIDVAFLDESGRVVTVHEMSPEPPRRRGESAREYEHRLPVYASGAPVQFAIETAGGRLRALGIAPGAQVALDVEGLTRLAK